jgi:hypothetical protein
MRESSQHVDEENTRRETVIRTTLVTPFSQEFSIFSRKIN